MVVGLSFALSCPCCMVLQWCRCVGTSNGSCTPKMCSRFVISQLWLGLVPYCCSPPYADTAHCAPHSHCGVPTHCDPPTSLGSSAPSVPAAQCLSIGFGLDVQTTSPSPSGLHTPPMRSESQTQVGGTSTLVLLYNPSAPGCPLESFSHLYSSSLIIIV